MPMQFKGKYVALTTFRPEQAGGEPALVRPENGSLLQ